MLGASGSRGFFRHGGFCWLHFFFLSAVCFLGGRANRESFSVKTSVNTLVAALFARRLCRKVQPSASLYICGVLLVLFPRTSVVRRCKTSRYSLLDVDIRMFILRVVYLRYIPHQSGLTVWYVSLSLAAKLQICTLPV